ncbi:hypothetical protein F5Y19DRAFT_33387 [Xylariaceae sp. FL1651]|nr:hypothetical protein F5Y19DRAFT_33387 [Xylariaceae sp. FL1651]
MTGRLSLRPCHRHETVYPDGKRWFTPIEGPHGFLVCLVCFCDYVLLAGQESKWRDAGSNLVNVFGVSVRCCFGSFNMKALAAKMLETIDYTLLWKAIDICAREPPCESKGMQGAMWYTLLSNPAGFEICRTCYAAIVEPMGVGAHFMLTTNVPAGSTILCSFNPNMARLPIYMSKLLDMVYKQDPKPLEEFIKEYALIPLCRRDKPVENARWFGWNQCTICQECHHELIHGTALADKMPHQGTHVQGGVMCEMYSQRMRTLYLATCAADQPDLAALLEASMQRRAVWIETMPHVERILNDQVLKAEQHKGLLNQSMFNTWSGNLMQSTVPSAYTYGNATVGYGFHNQTQLQGAELGRQASELTSQIGGSPMLVTEEPEGRWRVVE